MIISVASASRWHIYMPCVWEHTQACCAIKEQDLPCVEFSESERTPVCSAHASLACRTGHSGMRVSTKRMPWVKHSNVRSSLQRRRLYQGSGAL